MKLRREGIASSNAADAADGATIVYQQAVAHCYDSGYRVNSAGEVVSPKGKIRKLYLSPEGYLTFSYSGLRRAVTLSVHRLCGFQKYGRAIFDPNLEIRHIDGVKQNNTSSNLVLGTHSQNMMDQPPGVRLARAKHASSFNIKYNHEAIRKFHANGDRSYKDIMVEFGISSKGTVNYILRHAT